MLQGTHIQKVSGYTRIGVVLFVVVLILAFLNNVFTTSGYPDTLDGTSNIDVLEVQYHMH